MSEQAPLPGYWRFAWMFFMQPVSLQQLLQKNLLSPPEHLRFRRIGKVLLWPELRTLLHRLAFLVLAVPTGFNATLALAFTLLGFDISWSWALLGSLAGIACGLVFGSAIGSLFDSPGWVAETAFSVALAVALGVSSGIALGETGGISALAPLPFHLVVGVGVGLSSALVLGIVGSVAFAAVHASAYRAVSAIGVGLLLAFSFFLFGAMTRGEETPGIIGGVVFGLALPLVLTRLPLWPIEALHQALLYVRHRVRVAEVANLARSPVLWHDLSYLPLPFLGRHIESTAKHDPALARRALDGCAIAPGQQDIGRRTLERLQATELREIATSGRFRAFVDADTTWLPPEEVASPEIGQFRQVARYLIAAEASSFPHHRLSHLDRATKSFDHFLRSSNPVPERFLGALHAWRRALDERRHEAEQQAEGLLPVPFRAGEPLDPERGIELFRGREDSIRAIEQHLALVDEARSVLLLGPRRTGKTSLLKMLPTLLPDAVCVFFDLQGHPVDTPAGFFRSLADETRRQARRSRQLDLPPLDEGPPPFEAAATWIQALEDRLGPRRLLICLDEFEVLERGFGAGRDELMRLMGLIRSTIQHRRRVRLLIAGEAPFDELDGLWDAHFVSVREVRLGHLDPTIARDLVRRPTDDFPADAIPEVVAADLVERTGAQPFLVQLFAQILVSQLNDAGRQQAGPGDLDAVEEEAMTQVGSYFRDLWNRTPGAARPLLEALARGDDPPTIGKRPRRWLLRRCLIDDRDRLTIPVFGRFLVDEVLD